MPYFSEIATNMIKLFSDEYPPDSFNNLLVVIEKDHTAKIYKKFPLAFQTVSMRDIKPGSVVMEDEVRDIKNVLFEDSYYKVDIQDGDKVVYLFRNNWRFGLFFDFSKKLKVDKFQSELGDCYNYLFYYQLFEFAEDYFDNMVEDGWFPFFRFNKEDRNSLMQHYKYEKKHEFLINSLVDRYDEIKIREISNYWWRKKQYKEKKQLIEAGLNAYLQNTDDGFINCIKNLYSEIDGLLRLGYYKANQKEPSFSDLKNYIDKLATERFDIRNTVGFPKEFCKYLNKTFFKNYDQKTGNIDLSRHSSLHGCAESKDYTKIRALQAILTLDQIYFFL